MESRTFYIIKVSQRTLKICLMIASAVAMLLYAFFYAQGKLDVDVAASVGGWFNTRRIDNETLAVSTNMNVWVNGTKFIKCSNDDQPTRREYFSLD